MVVVNPRRARLADKLRATRSAVFESGNQFAAHLGWQQSRVSKLETGAQLPTEVDIDIWVRETRAGDDVRVELLALLSAARMEYTRVRDEQSRHGLASWQAYRRAVEAEAKTIAEYQPALIPGLVQTTAYAKELLTLPGRPESATEADIDALIAQRVRRQEILYEPGKRVRLLVGEAALRGRPGAVETLRGQLDRLLMIGGLASVDLGVLPFAAPMPVMPLSGFMLLDEDLALVESLAGEQRFDEPDDVALYRKAFDALMAAAVRGQGLTDLIRRVLAEL